MPSSSNVSPEDLARDWPGLAGTSHRFTVDPDALRRVADALDDGVTHFGTSRAPLTIPAARSWGGWDSAPRTRTACEDAMQTLITARDELLRACTTAAALLRQSARTYQHSDSRSRPVPDSSPGHDPLTSEWG